MPGDFTQAEQFIRAVHRRLVVIRAIETCGLGVLAACAVSLLLVLAALVMGRDVWGLSPIALGIGGLAGLVSGALQRPTRLQAAMEADRQLQLADLLSTVVLAGRDARSDPWATSVLAMADARCRALAPSAVVLNRYGARAWGGIGLSAALVLTLGAMTSLTGSPASRAGNAGINSSAELPEPNAQARAGWQTRSSSAFAAAEPANESRSSAGEITESGPNNAHGSAMPGMSQSPGGGIRAGTTAQLHVANPPSSADGRGLPGDAVSGTGSGPAANAQGEGKVQGTVAAKPGSQASPWHAGNPERPTDPAQATSPNPSVRMRYIDVMREYFPAE